VKLSTGSLAAASARHPWRTLGAWTVVAVLAFAQVWTLRDGKQIRMEMYSNPEEALEAAGLRSGCE